MAASLESPKRLQVSLLPSEERQAAIVSLLPRDEAEIEDMIVAPTPIVTALPTYSLVSEKLRRASAGSLQCSLFCGGLRCKYEVPNRWREEDKAINGLFSHWVTEDILAMARPSTSLFREYQLIEQFKRLLRNFMYIQWNLR